MTTHDCIICEEPGRFDLRITTLEDNYNELKGIFRTHKQETFKKFDKINSYLIATLTTAIISAILLIINLIIIYGGR